MGLAPSTRTFGLVWHAVAMFALFIVTLAAAATISNRIDPFRELEQLHEKWDYWRQHKDEYDTVFIGTSRTYRGVMPALFDQLTKAAGMPTHSFNFGVDGMISPEDAYVADYVLRDPPKNLRWVFLEVGKFEGNFDNRDPKNIRTTHWHDWPRTWLCIQSTLWPRGGKTDAKRWFKPDGDQPWPIDTAWTHLRLFFGRALNLGRGAVACEAALVPKPMKSEILGPAGDGFFPYPPDAGLKGNTLDEYRKALATRQQTPARIAELRPPHQQAVDSVVELARKQRAQPVLFLAPGVGGIHFHPADRPGVRLIDFYDVSAYPELFVPEVRVDMQHLNAKGAEIFTRELAKRFIDSARKP